MINKPKYTYKISTHHTIDKFLLTYSNNDYYLGTVGSNNTYGIIRIQYDNDTGVHRELCDNFISITAMYIVLNDREIRSIYFGYQKAFEEAQRYLVLL